MNKELYLDEVIALIKDKSAKRKIRKDFYKIKKELGLNNYMFDDLRFCNHIDN